MKAQKEKERQEQAERQAIIEQERRDREIALRLAAEDQNQVEDVTLPPLVRYADFFLSMSLFRVRHKLGTGSFLLRNY